MSAAGFQIDRKIGKGQFSVVYRAKALHNGMVVALKKVQIFEMMDSKARLDCMKEIQLLQVKKRSARGLWLAIINAEQSKF
jgi:NIMA (never in mitosis gene a)-related kinase 7